MNHNDDKSKRLRTDDEMLRKILTRECGDCETDEFAADELELNSLADYEEEAKRNQYPQTEEFAEDAAGIGESEYFSTCNYTMIPTDDDTVNCQGS
ncbi:MAG: hypothetical protein K2L51_04470 [Clostridiales bacterium]|nr:hypothetical protein [Clostridiales bacterium]